MKQFIASKIKSWNTWRLQQRYMSKWRLLCQPLTPVQVTLDNLGACLLIAPHADDESIGLGGLLCFQGEKFDVVCVTDCRLGITGASHNEAIHCRRDEFSTAMKMAGVKNSIFTTQINDSELRNSEFEFHDILSKLQLCEYSHIFLPHPLDQHPDHWVTARLFRNYVKKIRCVPSSTRIVFYEVWSPLAIANSYVDISTVIEKKMNLIACYKSQIKIIDYDVRIKGLNAYRGMTPHVKYAEYFHDLSLDEYMKLEL